MPTLSVRFVEIDSMGNEREIGIARNYNINTAAVMNPISGFGNNRAQPPLEVTIEVEGWKTAVEPITSTSQLVHRDQYDAMEKRMRIAESEVAQLKAIRANLLKEAGQEQQHVKGMQILIASLVHMMGGSVIVSESELNNAADLKFEAEDQVDPILYILKTSKE